MSNAELSIPNLERKLKEEGLNAINWREVGLKLGLAFDSLQVIEADVHPPSQIQCLYKMLNNWCRQDPTATMEKYTRALRLVSSISMFFSEQLKAWVVICSCNLVIKLIYILLAVQFCT